MGDYMEVLKSTNIKVIKSYKNTVKETVLGKISKIRVLRTIFYKVDLNEKGFNLAKEYGYKKLSYMRKTPLPYKSMLNLKNNDYKTMLNKLN